VSKIKGKNNKYFFINPISLKQMRIAKPLLIFRLKIPSQKQTLKNIFEALGSFVDSSANRPKQDGIKARATRSIRKNCTPRGPLEEGRAGSPRRAAAKSNCAA
jgi:hypothetical protein